MSTIEELGQELRCWRLRQRLSQPEVAERWGVSRYSILRVEKGKYVGQDMLYLIGSRLTTALREEAGIQ